MGAFSKLKKIIEENDKFLLIGHEEPDGDCLGSLLAFKEFLINLGKNVAAICKDPIPEVFRFLPGQETIASDYLAGDYEAIILLDNGDLKRTGFYERLNSKALNVPIVNIDHHTKNDIWRYANVNLANENASSTAELIFDIITGLRGEITPSIATALLCGIYYDTGSFKHQNTSGKVLGIASVLLSYGAKLKLISKNVLLARSVPMLKLWGIALNRLIMNKKYRINIAIILQEDIKRANASEDDVSGLVNLMNTVPEAKASLLLYEGSDGKIKGSLRTEKNNMDVSKLAKILGGGGHKKAAGFSFEGRIVKNENGWEIV